jgi:zinc D-Ala-D-Ala carboxypeptidase
VNLTQNFTLSEMTKSETALRFGMANDPTETEIENMRVLCEKVLQPVRNYYGMGVKVNSGYRHPLGKRQGWWQCNIRPLHRVLPQTSRFPVLPTPNWRSGSRTTASSDQLNFGVLHSPGVPDSGWVHVSYDPSDNKKQVLTATKKDGKTVYLPGLVA